MQVSLPEMALQGMSDETPIKGQEYLMNNTPQGQIGPDGKKL